jgi:hypothetical protein
MTEPIRPVLSTEEWTKGRHADADEQYREFGGVLATYLPGFVDEDAVARRTRWERATAAIAVINDALPDSELRKITADLIEDMRTVADSAEATWPRESGTVECVHRVRRFADALESYLPHEHLDRLDDRQ